MDNRYRIWLATDAHGLLRYGARDSTAAEWRMRRARGDVFSAGKGYSGLSGSTEALYTEVEA